MKRLPSLFVAAMMLLSAVVFSKPDIAKAAAPAGNTYFVAAVSNPSGRQIKIDFYPGEVVPADPLVIRVNTKNTQGPSMSLSSVQPGLNTVYMDVPGYGHWQVAISKCRGQCYDYGYVWVRPDSQTMSRVMTATDEFTYDAIQQSAPFILFDLIGIGSTVKIIKGLTIGTAGALAWDLFMPDTGPYPVKKDQKWVTTITQGYDYYDLRTQVFELNAYGQYHSTPSYDQTQRATFNKWY